MVNYKFAVVIKFAGPDYPEPDNDLYCYSAETLETACEVLSVWAHPLPQQGTQTFAQGEVLSASIMTAQEFLNLFPEETPLPAEDCGFGEPGVVYGAVALAARFI